MARTEKLKKNKGIWALIIVLTALASFVYIILYTGGVVIKKTDSTEVLSKLKDIQVKGGDFELTQKDLDELSNLYFGNPKRMGYMSLKGINIEMFNGELLIKVPISYNSYKKVNLLFSSKGKLNFSNGEIIYAPENFKIGKLILPKNLVISKISKFNNKCFSVEDNLIKIKPSIFPFKIIDLKIEDNKILGKTTTSDKNMLPKNSDKNSDKKTDKQVAIADKKIQNETVAMNEVDSEKKEELDKIRAEVEKSKQSTIEKEKEDTQGNEKQVTSANEEETKEQREANRVKLAKVHDDLGDAYSQVESPKEQQIIGAMRSSVSKLESDPSYDATSDQASVKANYSKLDSDSKKRVKSALLTNVDADSAEQLSQAFGLK